MQKKEQDTDTHYPPPKKKTLPQLILKLILSDLEMPNYRNKFNLIYHFFIFSGDKEAESSWKDRSGLTIIHLLI